MLEGLINNHPKIDNVVKAAFELNSMQIYQLSLTEHKDLDKHLQLYKKDYNLSLVEVYCNMALIKGQLKE